MAVTFCLKSRISVFINPNGPSEANHRIPGSVFFDPFGITIGHEIQSDVMFKESFQARGHQLKPLESNQSSVLQVRRRRQ